MNEEQRAAWGEVVAAAKRDAANHRMSLNIKMMAYYQRGALRRKLARCEAILAMDALYQQLRQIEEEPGAYATELDDLLS